MLFDGLLEQVERAADERILDVISLLINRKPSCRKLDALYLYVGAKRTLHRMKKKLRWYGNHPVWGARWNNSCEPYPVPQEQAKLEKEFVLVKQQTEQLRRDYYERSCDCGTC
jgi:hypothetical protein